MIIPKAYSNYVINIGSLELQDIINRMGDKCECSYMMLSCSG